MQPRDWAVVVTVMLLSVVYLGLWVHPPTRPYAKKYWWVLASLVLTVVAVAASGIGWRRTADQGDVVVDQANGAVMRAVNHARLRAAEAELDLTRNRTQAREELDVFESEVSQLPSSDSVGSVARRQAVLDLVNRSR